MSFQWKMICVLRDRNMDCEILRVSSARDEFARPNRDLYASTTRTAIFLATMFYANESTLNDFNFFGVNALTFPFLERFTAASTF